MSAGREFQVDGTAIGPSRFFRCCSIHLELSTCWHSTVRKHSHFQTPLENPSVQTHFLVLLCCLKRLCIFGPKGAIQIRTINDHSRHTKLLTRGQRPFNSSHQTNLPHSQPSEHRSKTMKRQRSILRTSLQTSRLQSLHSLWQTHI